MPPPAPIVYLGPSLPRAEAQALLPGADFRPPIRRGDLHRARERGGSVFVIVDGVFFQEHAISPREVVDVVRDGALVVGAASMGALRAAECWPAGMLGVGAIYRLFRRGRLTSDDEVAVVFDPDGERPPSLALVNARYALSRALRRGDLTRRVADTLVRVAEETFYAERTWPTLLARAGVRDRKRLERRLSAWDLKGEDARRALRFISRRLATAPGTAHRPRPDGTLALSERVRERRHSALAGLALDGTRRAFGRWQLVSGRYTRHALPLAVATPGFRLEARLREKEQAATVLAARLLQRQPGDARAQGAWARAGAQGVAQLVALRLALLELRAVLLEDEEGFAERLWQQLTLAGELDAELFRWRAIHEAAAKARAAGLTTRPRDRYFAREELAHAHGFESWSQFERAARAKPGWPSFPDYVETRALSRRARESL